MTQESFQNLEKKQGKEFLQWHGHSVTARSALKLPIRRQPWSELCGKEPLVIGVRVSDWDVCILWAAHKRHAD